MGNLRPMASAKIGGLAHGTGDVVMSYTSKLLKQSSQGSKGDDLFFSPRFLEILLVATISLSLLFPTRSEGFPLFRHKSLELSRSTWLKRTATFGKNGFNRLPLANVCIF